MMGMYHTFWVKVPLIVVNIFEGEGWGKMAFRYIWALIDCVFE